MSRSSQFFRNVTSNYAVVAIEAVIFVLLTPFIVHELGIEQYAVWVIIVTIGYYLDFFDLGIPDAQVREHSRMLQRGDVIGLQKLSGTVLVVYIACGLAAMAAATVLAALPTPKLFGISAEYAQDFPLIVTLLGFIALLTFVANSFDGIYEGYRRYDLLNATEILLTIIDTILIVGVLIGNMGLVGLVVAKLIVVVVEISTKFAVVHCCFSDAAPALKFDRETWGRISNFSLWNSLNDIATEGTAHFDKLLIPILLTVSLLTPYSLTVTLAALLFALAEPITDTLLPETSRRIQANDKRSLSALLIRTTNLVVLVTLPVAIVISLFGHSILDLWIGPEYTEIEDGVLWFTIANFYFSAFLWPSINVLLGAGEVRRIFFISLSEVALVLLLILLLVPSHGLVGLAAAGFIANILFGILYFLRDASIICNISIGMFVRKSIFRPLLACVPAFVAGLYFRSLPKPETWLLLIGYCGITGLIAVFGVLVLGLPFYQRLRFAVSIRRLSRVG